MIARQSRRKNAVGRAGWIQQLSKLGWPRVVASFLVIAVHVLAGHSDYTVFELMIAGTCGAVTLQVIWTYFAATHRGLPVLEWVMFQLYLFFAMPVFSKGTRTMSVSFGELSRAGAVRDALLATLLFMLALLGSWAILRRPSSRATDNVATRPIPLFLICVYGVIGLIVSFQLSRQELSLRGVWYTQILQLVFLPAIAQMLLLFELQRRPTSGTVRLVLISFTAMMSFTGLLGSRLNFALVPLLTLGIGMLAMGAKLPKRVVVLLLLLLVLLNPAKRVYRELTGYRTADFASLSVGDMIEAWGESLEKVWGGDEGGNETAFENTTKRLNSLSTNAAVIAWVPKQIPYAKGDPWRVIPYSLVPRFLWPGKPDLTEITNDRFAVLFGMTTVEITKRSTYEYPVIADAYWNFGWGGIVLTGFLVGLYWNFFYRLWRRGSRYRYVLPFLLLIQTRATVSFPHLVLGILQIGLSCVLVIAVLELAGLVLRGRTST